MSAQPGLTCDPHRAARTVTVAPGAARREPASTRHRRAAAALRTVSDSACWLAIFLIRFYQAYIRPHLFGNCKFTPTCSHYGIGCFEKHGFFRGGWLTLRRLARCHPFAKGGHDPVP